LFASTPLFTNTTMVKMSCFGARLVLLVASLLLLKLPTLGASGVTANDEGDASAVAVEGSDFYNIDNGILKRVTDRLDDILGMPVQAVSIIQDFHDNQGFRPYGLHAPGRDRVLSYMWSLIQSFHGLSLYFGTEDGEYFAFFETEAVYREPGNSGYSPEEPGTSENSPDDPFPQKYYDVCVNGDDGSRENCTMAEGAEFVQCIDDCNLVPCPDEASQRDCETIEALSEKELCRADVKWCPSYSISQVPEGATLGFVPVGYHCINEFGLFSQEPGKALYKENLLLSAVDGEGLEVLEDGTCTHYDGTPVTRVISGPFEYCKGQDSPTCNGTYAGLMRTLNYDPRVRPWYIGTKATQKEDWSEPYPFSTHSNIVAKIGLSYTRPFFKIADDGKRVFEGVFAVDYTLSDLSNFLTESFGYSKDVVVAIFEAEEPYYLIGVSTGARPYKEVQASDETLPCNGLEGQDCVTVRVSASDVGSSHVLDGMLSRSVQAQIKAGFPSHIPILAKEGGLFSATYMSHSVNYTHAGTSLQWIVALVSPVDQSNSDTIEAGDTSFILLICVAVAGVIGCTLLVFLWRQKRNEPSVRNGDYVFTGGFMIGCIIMNLCSLLSIGENTNAMCMARLWSFNMSFTVTMAPLLVKVYRVYKVVGHAQAMRRVAITTRQAAWQMLPIVLLQVILLLLFTFVDPPRAFEEADIRDGSIPTYHITCETHSRALSYTDTAFKATIVATGCVLSYLSRNLDHRFGESKQLLFAMYNIALTGICLVLLISFVDSSPEAFYMFRALGVFWGTTFTSAAFVIPRVMDVVEEPQRQKSSTFISGLDERSMISRNFAHRSSSLPVSRRSFDDDTILADSGVQGTSDLLKGPLQVLPEQTLEQYTVDEEQHRP
jgi:hypothetical protein